MNTSMKRIIPMITMIIIAVITPIMTQTPTVTGMKMVMITTTIITTTTPQGLKDFTDHIMVLDFTTLVT